MCVCAEVQRGAGLTGEARLLLRGAEQERRTALGRPAGSLDVQRAHGGRGLGEAGGLAVDVAEASWLPWR